MNRLYVVESHAEPDRGRGRSPAGRYRRGKWLRLPEPSRRRSIPRWLQAIGADLGENWPHMPAGSRRWRAI